MNKIITSGYLWLFCFLAFILVGCSKDNNDTENLEIERQRIVDEVISNLSGQLVYQSDKSSNVIINNFKRNPLELNNISLCGPKWSPDGQHIAITEPVKDSIFVKILNQNGSLDKSWLLIPSNQSDRSVLTWSPDGNTIAVLTSTYEIIYLKVATGEKNTMQIDLDGVTYTFSIAWCPKNNKIAIGQLSSISMIEPLVNHPKKELLVDSGFPVECMDWNKEGSMLTYSESLWGNIYTVNFDGSDNQKVLAKGIFENKAVWGYAPCWNSDGQQIVYVGIAGTQGTSLVTGLFVTDLNGSYNVNIDIKGRYADCY